MLDKLIGVITHMLLVVLLIAVLHMGVEAAALAVLLNNAWQAAVLFWKIRRDPVLAPSLSPVLLRIPEERRELWKNGLSKAGMTILVGIGGFFMQRGLNGLSTTAIAAYSYAAGTLNNFFMQPLGACATTAQVTAAQSFGAEEYQKQALAALKQTNTALYRELEFDRMRIRILLRRNSPHTARPLAERCAAIEREYRGPFSREYLRAQDLYADVLAACGDLEEAIGQYEEVMKTLTLRYPGERSWSDAILEKWRFSPFLESGSEQ